MIPIFGSKKLINSKFRIKSFPDLTYQDFFEAFSSWMYNGRPEGFDGYRAEVHDPMFAEIEAGHDFDHKVNVHRRYVTHFFRNNPQGAQRALRQFLDFVLSGIYGRGLAENWDSYGPESVLPFIRSYVEHGASVHELREFIQNYVNEELFLYPGDHDPEILQQLKNAILSVISVDELRKKAFNRRKHALTAWQLARNAEGNQGGGRRRSIRKRKASKKTRRSHRVKHRK